MAQQRPKAHTHIYEYIHATHTLVCVSFLTEREKKKLCTIYYICFFYCRNHWNYPNSRITTGVNMIAGSCENGIDFFFYLFLFQMMPYSLLKSFWSNHFHRHRQRQRHRHANRIAFCQCPFAFPAFIAKSITNRRGLFGDERWK